MSINRIKVAFYFFFGTKNGVTFKEFLNYFFAGSYSQKAAICIDKIEEGHENNTIYIKRCPKPIFYPKMFPINLLNQVIVETLYSDNWHYYEIPQTFVNKNDIVVDCGAAEGLFSLLVSPRCKKLYIIEPLPVFIKCLEETFETNDNVEILPLAISDIEANARLSINGISSNLVNEGNGIDVTVTTLDKLFYEKEIPITYIKIDLEGHDYKAIKGAEELIRKNKPKIAITTYHNPEHEQQIRIYLKSIVPEYNILSKGIYQNNGSFVMLHAWI